MFRQKISQRYNFSSSEDEHELQRWQQHARAYEKISNVVKSTCKYEDGAWWEVPTILLNTLPPSWYMLMVENNKSSVKWKTNFGVH